MQQIIQYNLFDTNIVSSNYGDYAPRSLSDRDYLIKSSLKFIDLFAGIGGFILYEQSTLIMNSMLILKNDNYVY